MARIRTIKPEFFRHEGLFEAEKETGLPLRVAFAGLWSAADRDGRFKWSPRNLKLDALPFDDVDFSRVLDALATRGHIKKYTSNGKEYGFIPSWKEHQVINNRESASDLPDPKESETESDTSTRGARVDDATCTPLKHAQGEGKGKEGKGRDKGTRAERTLSEWMKELGEQDAIPSTDPIFEYAEKTAIPVSFLELSWKRFVEDMSEKSKKQKDWRQHYRNAVKGNWYKLWWFTPEGECKLTTPGEQARRAA